MTIKILSNKYIVTVFSFAIASALIYFSYRSGKNQEYASFNLFIKVILWYLNAVATGTIAITLRPAKLKSITSIILYIVIGTLDIMISVFGALWVYIDSGSHLNAYTIFFILPFIMGLIIFKDVFFNNHQLPSTND